jgi:hypothetical protein
MDDSVGDEIFRKFQEAVPDTHEGSFAFSDEFSEEHPEEEFNNSGGRSAKVCLINGDCSAFDISEEDLYGCDIVAQLRQHILRTVLASFGRSIAQPVLPHFVKLVCNDRELKDNMLVRQTVPAGSVLYATLPEELLFLVPAVRTMEQELAHDFHDALKSFRRARTETPQELLGRFVLICEECYSRQAQENPSWCQSQAAQVLRREHQSWMVRHYLLRHM